MTRCFPTRTGRRLSDDAVAARLALYRDVAAQGCPSLQEKRLTPHVLRHTCAMTLLRAGVDVAVIALWLGHADVRSTNVYLHADMRIKERALARRHHPRRESAGSVRPIGYWPSLKVCDYPDQLHRDRLLGSSATRRPILIVAGAPPHPGRSQRRRPSEPRPSTPRQGVGNLHDPALGNEVILLDSI